MHFIGLEFSSAHVKGQREMLFEHVMLSLYALQIMEPR